MKRLIIAAATLSLLGGSAALAQDRDHDRREQVQERREINREVNRDVRRECQANQRDGASSAQAGSRHLPGFLNGSIVAESPSRGLAIRSE